MGKANPTTPEALEEVLTDAVLEDAIDVAELAEWIDGRWEYNSEDANYVAIRRVLLAALTPYLEAREQAIRASEANTATSRGLPDDHD